LSREVLAFGAFAASASAYAVLPWLDVLGLPASAALERSLGAAVALSGLAGVACSTMIYASTRRVFWNPAYTGLKFMLTCLVLGIPVALLMHLAAAAWTSADDWQSTLQRTGQWLCIALVVAAATKLLTEAAILCWLSARTFTPLRRTALLMTGDLARATKARFIVGALGGILLPVVVLLWSSSASSPAALTVSLVVALLGFNLTGELLERYLFFAAVVAPKMPGAPTA
jgi:DMSO reductase anchor subunit